MLAILLPCCLDFHPQLPGRPLHLSLSRGISRCVSGLSRMYSSVSLLNPTHQLPRSQRTPGPLLRDQAVVQERGRLLRRRSLLQRVRPALGQVHQLRRPHHPTRQRGLLLLVFNSGPLRLRAPPGQQQLRPPGLRRCRLERPVLLVPLGPLPGDSGGLRREELSPRADPQLPDGELRLAVLSRAAIHQGGLPHRAARLRGADLGPALLGLPGPPEVRDSSGVLPALRRSQP